MTPEQEQREAVIAEARTWLHTPYHHQGRVKGHGVDCLMLLAEVYPAALGWPAIEVPEYPIDWHLHRSEERYLTGLLQYARPIKADPQPGDIALWRYGRCFAHGAIVVAWPLVIHAHALEREVLYGDASQPPHQGRPVRFFSPWGHD